MNQILAGGTVLVITLILWGFGRNPIKLKLLKKPSFEENQANEQIVLVKSIKHEPSSVFSISSKSEITWQKPKTAKERIDLQRKLVNLMKQGPENRLEAIALAELWNHRSVLPLLKQAIHDSDSRVTIAAAKALEKFRGKTLKPHLQQKRPPRNVALMR